MQTGNWVGSNCQPGFQLSTGMYFIQPLVDQSLVQARGSLVSLGSGMDGDSWEEGTCLDSYAADCD